MGTINGVTNGDLVEVKATATYNDATVGARKSITVVYTLSGRDKDKYTAPETQIITTGNITRKPLTVDTTNITKSKIYNGDNIAAVSIGSINGIIENEDVTLQASAMYDNAEIGTGKTVTVTYDISGEDSSNYIKPEDTISSEGVITPIATLTASSSGISPDVSTITITLEDAITGLSSDNIVVKKDDTELNKSTYTLGELSGDTFNITFKQTAELEGSQAITVEIKKPGYIINSGNTISIENKLLKNVKSKVFNAPSYKTLYINLKEGTFKDRVITKDDFIFTGPSASSLENATFERTLDSQVKVTGMTMISGNHTITIKGSAQATQGTRIEIVAI